MSCSRIAGTGHDLASNAEGLWAGDSGSQPSFLCLYNWRGNIIDLSTGPGTESGAQGTITEVVGIFSNR